LWPYSGVVDPFDNFESPCVRTCVIDQQTKFCIGCGRTLHEISYWTRYTVQERRDILRQLPARLAAQPAT
jgi:predicted Fe-S protein YdhL (DUF1289 family)